MIQLLLVTYISRSGSTLFLNHLSKYANFCVCPEADVLVKEFLYHSLKNFDSVALKKRVNCLITNDKKLRTWNITEDEVVVISSKKTGLDIFTTFLHLYRNRVNPQASTIVFKAVEIANCYGSFDGLPKNNSAIKYVTLLRDPRGIFSSQNKTILPYQNKYFNTNPLITAYTFNHILIKSSSYQKSHRSSAVTLRFEDFIKSPNEELQCVCKKLKIRLGNLSDNENTSLYSRIPNDQRQIHQNVNVALIKDKVDEWKTGLSKVEKDLITHEINDIAKRYYPDIEKPRIGLMAKIKLLYFKARIFFLIDKY